MSSAPPHGPQPSPALPAPPGAWPAAMRLAQGFRAPIERFLAVEAASGLVLLAAAALAMILANSPLHAAVESLWGTPLGLQIGGFSFSRDLRWWINDGLMTIFFFLVGLELRREIHAGELSDLRRAALPLAGALGGMLIPALIYAALNHGRASAVGWAVPMATDIAFAVGVLALLGSRVAPALRVFLLALAVIDDLGAILVIAFFYSGHIVTGGLVAAGAGIAAVLGLQALGARSGWAFLPAALLTWGGLYASGVHPTLAGVALGLLTPVLPWLGPARFADTAGEVAGEVRAALDAGRTDLQHALSRAALAAREAVPPVERLQHALHSPVAFGVMPLFALANAGVPIGQADLSGGLSSDGVRVFLGVSLGLLIGKPLGIAGLSRLSAAAGIASLPRGPAWSHLSVVAVTGGIGFTMALFIAGLAFPPGPLLDTARLAILVGSAGAGVIGWLLGRLILPAAPAPDGARTEAEAEASTEV